MGILGRPGQPPPSPDDSLVHSFRRYPIDGFDEFAESMLKDAQIQAAHLEHCWVDILQGCMSCGCDDERPCDTHRGSDKWRNALLERQAIALEMIANDGKLG